MLIFVQPKDREGEKTIAIEVVEEETIANLKAKIQGKVGFPPDRLRLIYAGKELKDEQQTLVALGIKKESTVYLKVIRRTPTMQIFVRNLMQKCYTFDVNKDDSIQSIKIRIQEREGLEPEMQRLIYGGKQLDSKMTLADYNIQKNSTLHLMMRLRGGNFPIFIE